MALPPRRGPGSPLARKAAQRTPGHHYNASFLNSADRTEILAWLGTLHPLWEERFSKHFPPPEGQQQRRLLRPVYWLGNWQFACLDYYRPPKGVQNRCVKAEPFPAVLERQIEKVEALARRMFRGPDMPQGWHLNTCLVNFYGNRLEDGRWVDTARVGEHKDFEPGPVASLSLGERALIQFVTSTRPGERDAVVLEQWLDDGALQLFGGAQWKEQTFHRVQRVDTRAGHVMPPELPDFRTRRINLTFRYVPDAHVTPFAALSPEAREDVRPYMETLAKGSRFFREELAREQPPTKAE
ncbi:alpha-ketoglutarate-dependent dioxygenase AlkB [Corallococcus exiguus]|uniref:Alpha-ketoglutarate-dependent dioxygenase AlkB n=1 Tax=Corallococcus exiguus TaxID=83462 RepID=A0A7Y1X004_9BACT|nr:MULTISPECIES: alpha-ketoglutarate-dependent dioxygenase AlkB [Corallococcus]NBC43111.1 alpha-ketoglutarate-dependent dioxygenase AlkB [Corallococcus exiguus]NNC22158.1 alpha-ketoglutarate-dependent dioxygenase AlkB [Corallococcus exiguus]NRD58689.1 alpha-ketoglutarate-dependent dioxygenase AlkB [Corallococcus exiguus]RKH13287.1 alpha-ketoglutarate-dependent dioxygenase AlkB [Corallococcus sp. CA041A]RKI06467.1 alpha-ketoglutarate-dependent dioxygenase AlkB [Corallococcus sp. AB030]